MSFLQDYKIYSSGNEAPEIFHDWAALSALACFVSRKVWVPQGFLTVIPNMYILFVGNPGNGKSTAMKIGQDLVRGLEKYCPIVPSSITKEALTQEMGAKDSTYKKSYSHLNQTHEYVPALIFANELVTLLGTDPLGMIKFLTDIWDEPTEFKVKTKNKGSDHIPQPFVNLLGCMTPETTSNLLKESIISGGFARRCIFVYAQRRGNPVPRPVTTVEQIEARDRCIKHGALLCHTTGSFTWSKEAEVVFDKWYCENHEFVQRNADLWMNGYYTSKSNLVLKVAMLLALSETTDLILQPSHIKHALDMLARNEVDMHRVFDGTGRNPEATVASHIMTMLEQQSGVVPLKQVFVKMYTHGSNDEITRAVDHLKQADKVSVFDYTPPGANSTRTVIGRRQVVEDFARQLRQSTQKLQHELPAPSNLVSLPTDRPTMLEVNLTGHRPASDQD